MKKIFFALLFASAFFSLSAQAMTLEPEWGNEGKLCACDFASGLLTVEGRQGEKFSLSVDTDGQIEVNAPARATAGVPERIFVSLPCGSKEGKRLVGMSARSLDNENQEVFDAPQTRKRLHGGGDRQERLFSFEAVQCPQLAVRHLFTTASCPSQADFEFELENTGLTAESGEFKAMVVEGSAEFSPARFSLQPGEKTLFTLSVGLPRHLLSKASSETIEVRAVGKQSTAFASVPLIVPLCPQPEPTSFPGGPSPTPVQLAVAGLGSVQGENFLTGFLLARGKDAASFLEWARNTRFDDAKLPSVQAPQESLLAAGVILTVLLVVAGYAFYKDGQAKSEEERLAEKRRARLQKFRSEIGSERERK